MCLFYATYEPHSVAFFTREMYFLQPFECISLNATATETIIQNAKQFWAPAVSPSRKTHFLCPRCLTYENVDKTDIKQSDNITTLSLQQHQHLL